MGSLAATANLRIAIPVFPGFEELDAIGPLEVFGLAAGSGLSISTTLVASDPGIPVLGIHGLTLTGLQPLDEDFDLIVVPGGAWLSGGPTGVRLAVAEGILARWLAARHAGGAVIAGVCTGVFLLHAAGLLDGKKATTHHLALDHLRGLGVDVVEDRVVDAGDVLTAGGIASGLDLALWIVERQFGKSACGEVETMMEYCRQGGVARRAD